MPRLRRAAGSGREEGDGEFTVAMYLIGPYAAAEAQVYV